MTLDEAILKAFQELEVARLEQVPPKTREIMEALETNREQVVDALANSLYFTMAEKVTSRPELVNVIARQYLAIGIWIGGRAKELMEAKRPTNGQPQSYLPH